MRETNRGRVLFREKYDPQIMFQLAAYPFAFILTGLIMATIDLEIGMASMAIGVVFVILEFYLIPQRIVVTTGGIQPQVMRLKAIMKGTRFVRWYEIQRLWPLFRANMDSGDFEPSGFEYVTPILGTSKLMPGRQLNRATRVDELGKALKEGLGADLTRVWREIPDFAKDDIEKMRWALTTSIVRLRVTGLAQMYIPLLFFVEIQIFYVLLNAGPQPIDQICLLGLLLMTVSIVMAVIAFAMLFRSWKRQDILSRALSLYFQVRHHEENTGTKLLPQMQMLAVYRKFEPRPPPVEVFRAVEMAKRLGSLSVMAYSIIISGAFIPIIILKLVFEYHLSILYVMISLPVMPAMVIVGARYLYQAMELSAEIRLIVHEEWKSGMKYLPDTGALGFWGIRRDPVKMMQKSLPRLRRVVMSSGLRRKAAMISRDPVLKTVLEYERVTGRELLPPELTSLRGNGESPGNPKHS